MPLCALRRMQIFTRRPKVASRTLKVAASSSGSFSLGQFKTALASALDNSSPASTRAIILSKSSSLKCSTYILCCLSRMTLG
jgi:hypothetical protein